MAIDRQGKSGLETSTSRASENSSTYSSKAASSARVEAQRDSTAKQVNRILDSGKNGK